MSDVTGAGGAFSNAAKRNKEYLFDWVGKRIRRRRRLLGLTQEELGGMVGLRFQQIQKYESNGNKPGLDKLIDFGKAMNVGLEYFLPEEFKPKPVEPIDVPVFLEEIKKQSQGLSTEEKSAFKKFLDYEPGLAQQFTEAARENKEDLFEYVGQQIRRRRMLLGLTQHELGSMVGVSYQQIQKYETNGNKPSVETLIDMARGMHTPGGLEYFLPEQYKSAPTKRQTGMHPDLLELIQIQQEKAPNDSLEDIVGKAIDAALKQKANIPPAFGTPKPANPSP